MSASFDAMVTVAFCVPVAVGLNAMLKVPLDPAGMLARAPVTGNCAASEGVMEPMVSGALPRFCTVKVFEADVPATMVSANATLEEPDTRFVDSILTFMSGAAAAVPVPLAVKVNGEAASSETIDTVCFR